MPRKSKEDRSQTDVVYDFWRRWRAADALARREMVLNLAKAVDNSREIDDEQIRLHGLVSLLNGYFEDLDKYLEGELAHNCYCNERVK